MRKFPAGNKMVKGPLGRKRLPKIPRPKLKRIRPPYIKREFPEKEEKPIQEEERRPQQPPAAQRPPAFGVQQAQPPPQQPPAQPQPQQPPVQPVQPAQPQQPVAPGGDDWSTILAIFVFLMIIIFVILPVIMEDGFGGARYCEKRLTGGAFGNTPRKPSCDDTSETPLTTYVNNIVVFNGQAIPYSRVPCFLSGDDTPYKCP